MKPQRHLAQINVARLREPIDRPAMREFVEGLEPINALADRSRGFVWRLQTDAGDATSMRVYDDDMIIVNVSVWESVEALRTFMFRTDHAAYLRRRADWFERLAEASTALWWIAARTTPSVDEAIARLDSLRRHGPTAESFTLRDPFPAHAGSAGSTASRSSGS